MKALLSTATGGPETLQLGELPRPTAARYSLQDVDEVGELLRRLAALAVSAA